MERETAELLGRLEKVENSLKPVMVATERPEHKPEETVDCATCGCMVRKGVAVKGVGEIRKTPEIAKTMHRAVTSMAYAWGAFGPYPLEDEFIYYPYYCKRCAPKVKA